MRAPSLIRSTLRQLLAGGMLLAALACGGGGGSSAAQGPAAPLGAWGAAQVLETNLLSDSYYPQVAVDGAGRVLVVWFRLSGPGGPGDIWAKVYQPGSGWQPEGTIESMDGAAAYPVVGTGLDGTFFVAWQQAPAGGGPYAIYVNRYVSGSGWSGPLQISAGTTGAIAPQLAADASGNAIVVWEQVNGSAYYEVQASRFSAGGWSAPVVLGTSTVTNNYGPLVAMDPAGNGVVAWNRALDMTNGPAAVCAVAYRAGSGWQIPGSIPSLQAGVEGTDDAYGFSLAMSSAGAVIGWAETVNGSIYRPYARIWNPTSGTWSAAAGVVTTQDASVPQVGIDATGKVHAAWLQYTGSAFNDVYVASYSTSGGFTVSAQPVESLAGGIGSYSLHVNAGGAAALVWNQVNGSFASIYALRYDPARGWGSPSLLESDDSGNAYAATVRLSTNGQATATWYQKDAAGLRHIYANRWN